ncbi:MAG: O-methyltransferase [Muribaculaceae bacterium]|nr:O-methyltransferase [Muribaculaceae bacterium]
MNHELEQYIVTHIDAEPAPLAQLYRDTHLHLVYPHMCSGHLQGRLLKMLVRMVRPRRVLELGTYSGYSALCLAEGLPDDNCRVHTIEINDEMEPFIRSHLAASPVGHRVVLHIGNAATVLPSIDGVFDLTYIDANKRDYIADYERVLPRMRPGGFIIADNTLWGGKVTAGATHHDALTQSICQFNDHVARDPRVEKVILPLRDGLTLVYVL